jgi:hypothetical protein
MTIKSERRIGPIFQIFEKDSLSFILCVSCRRPNFFFKFLQPFDKPILIIFKKRMINKEAFFIYLLVIFTPFLVFNSIYKELGQNN